MITNTFTVCAYTCGFKENETNEHACTHTHTEREKHTETPHTKHHEFCMYPICLHPQCLATLVAQILDNFKVPIVRGSVQANSTSLRKHMWQPFLFHKRGRWSISKKRHNTLMVTFKVQLQNKHHLRASGYVQIHAARCQGSIRNTSSTIVIKDDEYAVTVT